MNIRARLEHLGATIACGLHSGIPECCVRFYACEWLWWDVPRMSWNRRHTMANSPGDHGYIPCLSCARTGYAVPLAPCPVGYCQHSEEQA